MRRVVVPPGRLIVVWAVVVSGWLAAALPVGASLPGGKPAAPRAFAPTADAVVPELGTRLAWTAPPNTSRHYLVVSATAFDPTTWTALPEDPAFTVRELEHPVAAIEELGLALTKDSDLWWAPVSVEDGSGRLAFGAAQRMRVLRRFANHLEPSPYLRTLPMGVVAPREEAAEARRQFGRLNAARAPGGAGLGLALVEAVAHLHHGQLKLGDNKPGLIAALVLPIRARE